MSPAVSVPGANYSVTEQIALLVCQDLVVTAPASDDRRRKILALTTRGRALNDRLGTAFEDKLDQLLGHYSAEDVRFCTDLLNALAGSADGRPDLTRP